MSRILSWETDGVELICLCYLEAATPAQNSICNSPYSSPYSRRFDYRRISWTAYGR